jgi:hypothetical protein
MTLPTQNIIRHLFQVDTLEEVTRQRLEELVKEHPSFGVGRYLLSCKLQTEARDHFDEATQKTSLYFPNPYWLHWLLQEDSPQPLRQETFQDNSIDHAPEKAQFDDTPINEPAPGIHSFVKTEEWNAAGEAELPASEVFAPVTDTTEATLETHPKQEEEPDEVGWNPGFGLEQPAEHSAADLLLQRIAAIQDERQARRKELEEALAFAQDKVSDHEDSSIPAQIAEPEESTAPVQVADPQESSIQGQVAEPLEVSVGDKEERSVSIAGLALEQIDREEETEAPAETPEIKAPDAPAPPVFEPFHTVDYFASQGIRLVQEENPSDRLGRQLKSFTDWLKVMRRLPQKNKEIVPDIAAERQVQAIAAHSIEGREVVTEAMAEVLAKQGMREKATEMYRKLSLLEPEKSAYFAAKIEQLKII